MSTQWNPAAKRVGVNLNYLTNNLDSCHHRVIYWPDAKSPPQQNEIEKLGIEIAENLCKRQVLKKKDINGMKFPERPLTPRRSRSNSPNRPTTPIDCQKKLDFNDDEDSYKVEADISHASCTCAQKENYYKCRISLLEKQKVELDKKLQRTAKNGDFESLANEYLNKYRDLKNIVDRLTGERNAHWRELKKMKYENAKLAEKNKSMKTHIFKNAEEYETLGLKTRSYENTIQSQKKLILEIQKRDEEQKIALKDADDALKQHILILERCRTEKNDAESMLSRYLLENDSVQRQCEIAQLQKNLQKQKQKADEQIHNLKKNLQEKENDLQQGIKCFNEINEKMKEMVMQEKDMSSRDRNELLDEKKNNRKLVKDNESLKDKIYEIENIHATVNQQHIYIESKFQLEVSNLKIQNSRADKKVANAEKELEDMTTKCKEQQSKYNSKRCQLESEIKELQLELDEMRNNETRKNDTERTIASLQQEKNCLEQELINARAKLDQIQSDSKLLKTEQVHQQNPSNGTIDDLLQQNRKLEDDKELYMLRDKVCSLENYKIKLEEKSENMCIRLREKDKELNHLKSVLNKAKFKSLELVADLDSGESMSDIEDENEKLQRNLSRLYEEINKTNKGIALNAQLMSARNQKVSKETSMSPGEGKITTGVADVNSYKNSENNESGSEHASACSGKGMIMSLSSYLNSTRHIVSEQHRTININANTVQISDNASITMSSNTSVDENRHHFEVSEPENQRQQEIEN